MGSYMAVDDLTFLVSNPSQMQRDSDLCCFNHLIILFCKHVQTSCEAIGASMPVPHLPDLPDLPDFPERLCSVLGLSEPIPGSVYYSYSEQLIENTHALRGIRKNVTLTVAVQNV